MSLNNVVVPLHSSRTQLKTFNISYFTYRSQYQYSILRRKRLLDLYLKIVIYDDCFSGAENVSETYRSSLLQRSLKGRVEMVLLAS